MVDAIPFLTLRGGVWARVTWVVAPGADKGGWGGMALP